MRRRVVIWGCLLLACALCFHVAQAQEVTVLLKDGRQIKGEMVGESDTSITLMIANIAQQIPRDNVEEIKVNQTPAEVFRQRKAALKADDVIGRYELASWANDNGHHRMALDELNLLAKQYPEHPYQRRITLLTRVVKDSISKQQAEENLRQAAADRANNGTRPTDAETPDNQAVVSEVSVQRPERPTRSARPKRGERWVVPEEALLSEEQINLIRVYEIDLSKRPTVIVHPDAIDTLFKQFGDDAAVPRGRTEQARFRGKRGYEQLEVIFAARAKELYSQIVVRDDPPAMRSFRTGIHRNYVIGYCGECHGNGGADGLMVVLDRPVSTSTVYSNFLTLSRIESARGMMIDRSRPEESLLLQYGLPREDAKTPHPDVEGWLPSFRGDWTRDPIYRSIVKWIGDELYRPTPNYGIRWTPPVPPEPAENEVPDPAERAIRIEGGE